MKKLFRHDINILTNFNQNRPIIECAIKILLERWYYMTFEVILLVMKNMRLHNVSILSNIYQNQFINECARKKTTKIP